MHLIDSLTRRWRERVRAVPTDGFGQSLVEDLRFYRRFRSCRQLGVDWRAPTEEECRAIDGHPVLGRFGDMTQLVADAGAQRWIVRDRNWYGWPDPPKYVFFALEGETVAVARDFDEWPAAWGLDPSQRSRAVANPM